MAAPPWSSSPTRNWFIQLAFYIILKLFFTPLPSTVWKNIKFFNLLTNFFHKQLVFFHFPKPLSKAWVFLFPLHGRSWNINYYHQQLKYLSSMAFSSHLFFSSIVTLTWSRPCKESIADMILWVAFFCDLILTREMGVGSVTVWTGNLQRPYLMFRSHA